MLDSFSDTEVVFPSPPKDANEDFNRGWHDYFTDKSLHSFILDINEGKVFNKYWHTGYLAASKA